MSRGQSGGLCTHVVNRGNARATVFRDEDDYAAFVELLGRACERVAVRVAACCVMPNHFHLVLDPAEEGELSRWMQWLMTSHVRRHHARYGTSGHVWQGRYKSFVIQRRRATAGERSAGVVQTADPVLQVVRYVERNPLRAGLVARAEDWPWSSLRWWADPSSAPEWWSQRVVWRSADWLAVVNRPQSDEELAALRLCLARGRPFGAPSWVRRIVANLGLESTLRPRGRPSKRPEK